MKGTNAFWAGAPDFMRKWQFWAGVGALCAVCVGVGIAGGLYKFDTVNSVEDFGADAGQLVASPTSPIFASGHPRLYDTGEEAEAFAKKYDSVITTSSDYSKDKTELSFNIYGPQISPSDTTLHGIEIYPRQDKISLEDAIEVARSYLPMEVMQEWYEQRWSKIYYDYNQGGTLYAQLYVPTEDGLRWIKENNLNYNYALVLVEVKDGIVQNIVLRSTNTMPNTGQKPKTEDWNFSIL